MTAYEGALLGTLFTFLCTAMGASTVFWFKKGALDKWSALCESFAAGVMLAASVFSLLLPALERARALHQPALAAVTAGFLSGAGLMLLLERPAKGLLPRLSHSSAMALCSITLHNIPEGMAVGLAFALAGDHVSAFLPAVTLAIGIGLQNIPEGAAVALPLCRDGVTRGRAFLLGTLSGAAEVLFGLVAVLFAARVHLLMPLLLSFAAGAMVYCTFRDLLPAAAQSDPSPRPALCAILGFVLMMALDVALG